MALEGVILSGLGFVLICFSVGWVFGGLLDFFFSFLIYLLFVYLEAGISCSLAVLSM